MSWWDLKCFIEHLPSDESSALWRALNPDRSIWSDPKTFLASVIANAVEDLKYLAAVQLPWDESKGGMPERYWPAQYGPKPETEPDAADDSDEKARQAAADLMAG